MGLKPKISNISNRINKKEFFWALAPSTGNHCKSNDMGLKPKQSDISIAAG